MFDRILVLASNQIKVALNETSADRLRALCLEHDPIGLRANYPWDLCKLARSIAEYEGREPVLDEELLPRAAKLYWAATGAPMSVVALTSTTTGRRAVEPAPMAVHARPEETSSTEVPAEYRLAESIVAPAGWHASRRSLRPLLGGG